ncbi:MAG: hypothetical protein V3W31_09625 [Thermodesulfobacteriota bacterium]
MGFLKKLFGTSQAAPNLPIHLDDNELVAEYDIQWWESLTLDDCKTLEQQDNVAQLALFIKLREDGLSEDEAARQVRKSHLFYYGTLEQRDDEPLGFRGEDAKLPYIIKDRANKAVIQYIKKWIRVKLSLHQA